MFTSGGASALTAAAAADAALLPLPSSDKRTPSLPLLLLQPNVASVAPGMVSVSAVQVHLLQALLSNKDVTSASLWSKFKQVPVTLAG
jgi:hypothetical protein